MQHIPVPFEIILADNHSTDATRSIARRYGIKIVDGGLPAAGRNAAAEHATGDLLLFLDADTVLPEGFIARNLDEFAHRKLAIATVLTKVKSTNRSHTALFKLWDFLLLSAEKVSPLPSGYCIFCMADIHQKIGGFNKKITMGEDLNYVSRAVKCGQFGVLRSVPIVTSARRLEKDGSVRFILRFFVHAFLKLMVGDEKASMLKYDFNYTEQRSNFLSSYRFRKLLKPVLASNTAAELAKLILRLRKKL